MPYGNFQSHEEDELHTRNKEHNTLYSANGVAATLNNNEFTRLIQHQFLL
jgi:hypothetical protein